MTNNEYLISLLEQQTLTDDSQEVADMMAEKDRVSKVLEEAFPDSSPTISFGGSKEKGTMVKVRYDIDIPCFFPNNEEGAGETLKAIFKNVKKALEGDYTIEEKTSALRLRATKSKDYTHIDVVPGRYIDDKKSDAFIYWSARDKERQQTNIEKQVGFIRDSGVTEYIQLAKLWRTANDLDDTIRTFVLELLVIEILKKNSSEYNDMDSGLQLIMDKFANSLDDYQVVDPANPAGNDLSEHFNEDVRTALATYAQATLDLLEDGGWEKVFEPVYDKDINKRLSGLGYAASASVVKPQPWGE